LQARIGSAPTGWDAISMRGTLEGARVSLAVAWVASTVSLLSESAMAPFRPIWRRTDHA